MKHEVGRIFLTCWAFVLLLISLALFGYIYGQYPIESSVALPAGATSADLSVHWPDQERKLGSSILSREVDKVNQEISSDLQETYNWYHFKFLFLGGLVGALLAYLGATAKNRQEQPVGTREAGGSQADGVDRSLIGVLWSKVFFLWTAVASIVSLLVDVHVRSIITNMQHGGTWISFVEKENGIPDGWESWLRTDYHMSWSATSLLGVPVIDMVSWLTLAGLIFAGSMMIEHARKGEEYLSAVRTYRQVLICVAFVLAWVVLEVQGSPAGFSRHLPGLSYIDPHSHAVINYFAPQSQAAILSLLALAYLATTSFFVRQVVSTHVVQKVEASSGSKEQQVAGIED